MTLQDIVIAENIIAIAAILAAVTGIILFGGKVIKFFKKTVHFFDDFLGEEERPGVPARPGFSERMGKMENCMSDVKDRIETMEYKLSRVDLELQPNSGKSLRDAIQRIEKRLEKVESKDI